MANDGYVNIEGRVRMTGIRRRRVISVLADGDGSRAADWDDVIWPNRVGHECDVMSVDAIVAGIRLACEAVQERCAEAAESAEVPCEPMPHDMRAEVAADPEAFLRGAVDTGKRFAATAIRELEP